MTEPTQKTQPTPLTQQTSTQFETVIGLEVHVQLSTKTKMFCGCQNLFGQTPNSQVCPVCLGLPGSLPVVNKKALDSAIKIGLALNCKINSFIKFDRKNYYYPDCPKNYQISQFDFPVCYQGHLNIPGKTVGITRAHLEEDAGKLIHDDQNNCSLVDYNRTGTPLVEIVSEPDMRSPQEAYDYLQNLKLVLSYLDVSDCDMEKGSLRCDANVSIREVGAIKLGTKTELKNMNSFRAVKIALEYEIERQKKLVLSGGKVTQETRLWDEEKGATAPMRSKEQAHDYRYFPDPDLVPFTIEQTVIDQIKKSLPELPEQKLKRFISEYQLSEYDAKIIIEDINMTHFFEDCSKIYSDRKKVCNWINGVLLQEMNNRKTDLKTLAITAEKLTELIKKVDEGVVSNLVGKDIFKKMLDTKKSADTIIQEEGLTQVSDDSALEKIVDEVIAQNPSVVEQIKSGKDSAAGFLVGQAMKKSQGKANPKKLGEMIKRRLS